MAVELSHIRRLVRRATQVCGERTHVAVQPPSTSITMPLASPILAVIALQAFLAAYGGFLWAFLVCQDERMWTLMVWLFQLQQKSGLGVVYASLIIAAIPTFLLYATQDSVFGNVRRDSLLSGHRVIAALQFDELTIVT